MDLSFIVAALPDAGIKRISVNLLVNSFIKTNLLLNVNQSSKAVCLSFVIPALTPAIRIKAEIPVNLLVNSFTKVTERS